MVIEKRVSYNVPEGKFRARLASIEVVRRNESVACRPNWEILSLVSVTTEYRAARSYRKQESDELLDVLEALTQGHPERVIGEGGKIMENRLHELIGVECELHIVHIPAKTGKHDFPFCMVVKVTRPGELVRSE